MYNSYSLSLQNLQGRLVGQKHLGVRGDPISKQINLILHTSYMHNANTKKQVTFAPLKFSPLSCKVVTHGRKECMRQYGTAC